MWTLSVYTVPLAVSLFFGLLLGVLVWRERPKNGAAWLAAVDLAVAVWSLGGLLVVSHTARDVQQFGSRLSLAALVAVPTIFLFFVLGYIGRTERLTPSVMGLLLLEPIVVGGLVLLDHSLVAPGALIEHDPGLLFELEANLLGAHYIYGMALLFLNEALLLRHILLSRNVYRRRTAFFLLLIGALHATHMATILGLSPTPAFTLTPLAFVILGTISMLVMVGYRNLSFLPLERIFIPFRRYSKNLTPLARNQAIEEMSTGFLVLDHESRIVDTNPVARKMLSYGDNERVIGKRLADTVPLEAFVEGPPGYMDIDPGETVNGRYDGVWIEDEHGDQFCFDILVSTLEGESGTAGYVSLIYDVTERERRKQTLERQTRELQRQNDRLEDFAGIVSHDLRNPLNVASGRLELVDAGDDQEHLDTAKEAMGRMEEIIDDVLTFARLGRTVEDAESVTLSTVAREAWDTVDTDDATLVVDTDMTVDASRSRLLRVFENLFRNSVEHGGTDVTVTLGPLDDGFYVADDGPGIPEDSREQVLEQGYTTASEGTGFGLSIVQTVVEAHDWEIHVGESESGGARFEITGVTGKQTLAASDD
jgi:PAS domain S-box-containing protein